MFGDLNLKKLGDLNPAEIGVLDLDAGLEKVFPFVSVMLRAWPLGELCLPNDLPLGDVDDRANRPGEALR